MAASEDPPAHAVPRLRLYTMTGGRTRPSNNGFDLIAYVMAARPHASIAHLQPECRTALAECGRPITVAQMASRLDLPVGVLRILLGDLLDRGLIVVRRPETAAQPTEHMLREVLHGLRNL